jgi:hypothetical protein
VHVDPAGDGDLLAAVQLAHLDGQYPNAAYRHADPLVRDANSLTHTQPGPLEVAPKEIKIW